MNDEIRERRQFDATRWEGRRRRAVPGHAVTIGTKEGKPGWLFGECECGQTVEAESPGVVESWAVLHRWQVSRAR
jgi:hypothetical protein